MMPEPIMSTKRTAILGALLTALAPISMSIYTPAMPELTRVFATNEAAIKLSLSLYFAGFAVAQLLSGPASDAFGRKQASLVFLSIFLGGGLLAVFAPTIEVLLLARLIQGIGASVGMTVARAIVRDQFTGADASSIMNLIGIMLAVGPAMGPTIGGVSLAAFGWKSVFFLMAGLGAIAIFSVVIFLRETTVPDKSLIRPRRLLSAYGNLLTEPRFLLAALVLGGSIGALYAQATMLTFILIDTVGMTPTAFGIGMLMQTGAYFFGSIALRYIAPRLGDRRSVMLGLCFSGTGGLLILLSVFLIPPSFFSIMGPVAVATVGIALLTPSMVTAALAPFPHIAGSASAMMGFIQMGSGFAGGTAASLIGSPLTGFGIVIPVMEFTAVASYIGFRIVSRSKT
ncbi:MFS transporter, DHA1 family, purine ribonucleoside efflux pump [Agrobacterium fabrum]|uniref:multidrug effflux MFS transporter n=1 Tax=Agrobacterium fabrum TaxID=1176649 RepID=UPI000892642B|nr:multidrug effflux MFS transporter [Agrobacterium fabrum]AYM63412.1 MFS transporter, DHA1 family, purine ribonucleoside efflux pump [Agrobacterium fabrum]MDH6297029.1 DHA1 family bicyclomycin/chloramphenicol resistance-like MFS transporter [Agrobacterium fabrum]SDB66114.1 MFS transporter, DHA1 family, purine ribonucleoside efflux pump [Agrobacterium fabrum]SER42701.1 MFS transporter, DHA1 family, purine ribonucleoside efflux pump [Agrobacterium fabrum]